MTSADPNDAGELHENEPVELERTELVGNDPTHSIEQEPSGSSSEENIQGDIPEPKGVAEPPPKESELAASGKDVQPVHLATSTFLSLLMVLGLLLLARLLVPSLVESIRYGWHRGELRAEYEMSGQRLKNVSLSSISDVSQLVSQRLGASVVHIHVQAGGKDPITGRPLEGQGSGFVIGEDGHIVTNEHVLSDGGNIEVTLSDGRKLAGTVVGADRHTDLAVVKVNATGLMPIEWGDSEKVVLGTPVWAVGSPFGLQQTVTFGIISGKHRVDFRTTRGAKDVPGTYGDLMQSDVALNPGNSGGPLVNSLGQVVGVNAAILGETFQGVSFSIPSRVAENVVQHLLEEGSVPRGWLGVALVDLTQEEKYPDDGPSRSGVRVTGFPNVSPAKKAGIEVGDVIQSIDGEEVEDVASLIQKIGESKAGSTVTLAIERPTKEVVDELATEVREAWAKMEIQVKLNRRNPRLSSR